jgi:uncharacterized membrane protein
LISIGKIRIRNEKRNVAIFCGGIAFMIVGIMFAVSGGFGIIIGLIIIGVGIVIVIGGYQDKKRIEKLDKLKKWDNEK